MDEIIPRAGQPAAVAARVLEAMSADKPKAHYVIGKDAKFAAVMQWLGLFGWVERKIVRIIRRATRLENKREAEKSARRKQKK